MADDYYIPIEPETIADLLSLYAAYESFTHFLGEASAAQVDREQILAMLGFLNQRFSVLSCNLETDVGSFRTLQSLGYHFPPPVQG